MKRIMSGRRYDTEAPGTKHVAHHSADCPTTDLRHWAEDLYRTKRGRWFLVGEGGPMTRWAKVLDENNWSGGSGLVPVSLREAREWLENADTTEARHALETYFAEEIEDA